MKDMLREMAKDVKSATSSEASASEVTSFMAKAKRGSVANEDIFKFAKLFKVSHFLSLLCLSLSFSLSLSRSTSFFLFRTFVLYSCLPSVFECPLFSLTEYFFRKPRTLNVFTLLSLISAPPPLERTI